MPVCLYPCVLSKEEVHAVIAHLSYPYDLVAKLLYGLRLFECLNLRIHTLAGRGLHRAITRRTTISNFTDLRPIPTIWIYLDTINITKKY
ncbi:hypothetical protein QUF72_22025 [Desulfobacterales bacterium HSG2]|nr:hypothetical protein [Desulfobacterales bacterium HSG2]